ncbi:unnamed protein product [Parajaminaea phylloscopi]
MSSSNYSTQHFASGQTAPVWSGSQPLNLINDNFVPARAGHPPPGTVPDDILPAGVTRPKLFETLDLPHSKLKLKNRAIVSPMCQYSARDGFVTPYHVAHLGSFALHGAGTIMVEASAVTPEGRITPEDVGIWKDEHTAAHASLASSLKSMAEGLTVGVQLAHAGRKASDWSPYYRGEKKQKYVTRAEGGWDDNVVAPSALAYAEGHITPKELSTQGVKDVVRDFVEAARRAFKAGYDFVEVHSAHGYLLHNFLSPLSNKRTDDYGGSFENRTRLLLEIVQAIGKEFPSKSVWVRISGTDFAEDSGQESWTLEDSKKLAQLLADTGLVDLLDVSAGGLVPFQKISPAAGYQLHLAQGVSSLKIPKSQLLVGAVGMLEGPDHPGQLAEELLQRGDADAVLLARGFLAKPSWVMDAGVELMGLRPAGAPQYHRVHPAASKRAPPRPQNTN